MHAGDVAGLLAGALAACAVIIATRVIFVAASWGGAVDHYYWILAARAYREMTALPVRIAGKYLLEDERQAYPMGFGLFLSRFSEQFLRSPLSILVVLAVDVVTLAILLAFAQSTGTAGWGLIGVALVYGLAPVLVAYNTQLTSRGLGNLFLVGLLLAEVLAVHADAPLNTAWWLVAVLACAAMLVTHKMTTQFFCLLLPFWALTMPSPASAVMALAVPALAFGLAMAVCGWPYMRLQLAAHADILSFWNRNWKHIGSHGFRHSPIYGTGDPGTGGMFHQPGLRGILRHSALIAGYCPSALLLPMTLFFAPPPPAWQAVWLAAAFAAATLTLMIPALRFLGGGHFYLFNAVAPAALWWGSVLQSGGTGVWLLFGVALAATLAALGGGWTRRRRLASPDLDPTTWMVQRLSERAPGRVAVYPVTAAERVALETHHAVFWGGHGLGFRQLEPHWPIVRTPLAKAFADHAINYVAIDVSWWPEGLQVIAEETGRDADVSNGRWVIFNVASAPAC